MAASDNPPAPLSYPNFEGLSKQEKIDAMVGYIMAASPKSPVTLPEPIEFIHKNVITGAVK